MTTVCCRRMLATVALWLLLGAGAARADKIDDFIAAEMQKRRIPGLSLAIINGGKVVKVRGYGVTELGGTTPITTSTLFQAGSISKSVAAVGALRMVEQGRLALDADVNTKLTTWKVPDNELTKDKKVTLRRVLSHSAGLTVGGFPGYAQNAPLPTLVQVLDGQPPANTPAIRVDLVPGSEWRYSGGGYTVMQQMMVDVARKPFPQLMQETVLGPIGMRESTFDQPLPPDRAQATANGHARDRKLVEGRWHIYPEMAAAGLWTTPSDLARFAIEIQRSLAGKSGKVLSAKMARQLVTNQINNDGLGVFLQGEGNSLRFSHNGRDEGFDAVLTAFARTGQGVAIMINANDNSRAGQRIINVIATEYRWPGFPSAAPKRSVATVDASTLTGYTGRYEIGNNDMLTLVVDNGRLFTQSDGLPDDELEPATAERFASTDGVVQVELVKDSDGRLAGLVWKERGRERRAPRIGPLIRSLKARPDPSPEVTRKVEAALRALAQGGKAVTDATEITAGVRKDLPGPVRDLAGLQALSFIDAQDVSARKLERHEGKVSQILYYKLTAAKGTRYVLVHMTPEGLVTDLDVVDD